MPRATGAQHLLTEVSHSSLAHTDAAKSLTIEISLNGPETAGKKHGCLPEEPPGPSKEETHSGEIFRGLSEGGGFRHRLVRGQGWFAFLGIYTPKEKQGRKQRKRQNIRAPNL